MTTFHVGTILKDNDGDEWELENDGLFHCGSLIARDIDMLELDFGPLETIHNPLGYITDAGDTVNHPSHYTSHPSGIECIQVTEHMNFNRGNAVKYIWRADDKGDPVENLKKAKWYIEREINRLEN